MDDIGHDGAPESADATPAPPPPPPPLGASGPRPDVNGAEEHAEVVATPRAEAPVATASVPPPPAPWEAPTAPTLGAPVWRPSEPAEPRPWPPPPAGGPAAPGWPPPPLQAPDAPARGPRGWIAVALVAALVGGGAGAGIAEAVGTGGSNTPAPTVKVGQATPGPALAGGAQIPSIVKSVLPEVVSIDAKGPGTSGSSLFGGGPTEDQGTGMIITGSGEVITNNHVISGATTITVTLYGQTASLPATLVGADPSNDVALLKINSPPASLQSVTFGDSQQLQVGDAVIAIGNALGLSAGTPTVTSGIVSATGRTVQAGDAGSAGETLHNMIQTDAAINSGNSGGPLVDSAGQVVGMSTAVASSSSGNAPAQNIGFAIASDTIQELLSTLRAGGTAGQSKAYLGVEVTDETPEQQQAFGLVPSSGALVVSVVSGSPADSAGIKAGDVIVAFNGKAVTSAQGLTNDVQATASGTAVRLSLYRGSQKIAVSATLGRAPAG